MRTSTALRRRLATAALAFPFVLAAATASAQQNAPPPYPVAPFAPRVLPPQPILVKPLPAPKRARNDEGLMIGGLTIASAGVTPFVLGLASLIGGGTARSECSLLGCVPMKSDSRSQIFASGGFLTGVGAAMIVAGIPMAVIGAKRTGPLPPPYETKRRSTAAVVTGIGMVAAGGLATSLGITFFGIGTGGGLCAPPVGCGTIKESSRTGYQVGGAVATALGAGFIGGGIPLILHGGAREPSVGLSVGAGLGSASLRLDY